MVNYFKDYAYSDVPGNTESTYQRIGSAMNRLKADCFIMNEKLSRKGKNKIRRFLEWADYTLCQKTNPDLQNIDALAIETVTQLLNTYQKEDGFPIQSYLYKLYQGLSSSDKKTKALRDLIMEPILRVIIGEDQKTIKPYGDLGYICLLGYHLKEKCEDKGAIINDGSRIKLAA